MRFKRIYEPRIFLYLLGLLLPFVVLGPHVAGQIWLAPSIGLGAMVAAILLAQQGPNIRLGLLALMVAVFALTSMGRFVPEAYAFSLMALFVVLIPLTIPPLSYQGTSILLNGFTVGFLAVLGLFWLEIAMQSLGMRDAYVGLRSLFIDAHNIENIHNYFIGYYRPYGPMPEPSALGYYFAFAFAIFDRASSGRLGWPKIKYLKWAAGVSVIAGGSLVGMLFLVTYVAASMFVEGIAFLKKAVTHPVIKKSTLSWIALVVVILIGFSVVFSGPISAGADRLAERMAKSVSVLGSGEMVGSEGSRLNSHLPLRDFWIEKGAGGVFVGTGYGKYDDWLKQRYGHLDGNISAARGDLDNRAFIVILSTGFVGTVVYFLFFVTVFRRFRAERDLPVIMLFIVSHFASGALLMYFHWQLLLVLFLVASARSLDVKKENLVRAPLRANIPGFVK